MVLLLIHQPAKEHRKRRINQQQRMQLQSRNCSFQHDHAHILDRTIHRIEQEQPLYRQRIALHGIKDRRHIHQQHREYIVKIRYIPKEHEQSRQNQPDADIENHQAKDRIKNRDEFPRKHHTVDHRKEEEHQQRDAKVDDRRNIFGQKENVFGHVDLCEDMFIRHQGVHAAVGRFAEEIEHQVAREQVGCIVIHRPAEELGEDDFHHQQGQERREDAPPHAQHGTLVFLLEVAFDEFFK